MGNVYLLTVSEGCGSKEFVFNDQGLVDVCLKKDIGHVRLDYNRMTQEDIDEILGASKETLVKALLEGDIVTGRNIDGNTLYIEAKPISARVKFSEGDIKKIKVLVGDYEPNQENSEFKNFHQLIELHEKLQLKEYSLVVELNPMVYVSSVQE